MKKVTLLDIKEALKDPRFRDSLPHELKEDIVKYLNNPGCACNVPFYRKLLKSYRGHLSNYFPNSVITDEAEEVAELAKNNWSVINCKASELLSRLRNLPPGRKQITVARWQDEITVIINELDIVY